MIEDVSRKKKKKNEHTPQKATYVFIQRRTNLSEKHCFNIFTILSRFLVEGKKSSRINAIN